EPLTLSIIHVNDTHSKLEPTQVKLVMDIDSTLTGKAVYAELGGFPDLVSALKELRSAGKNPVFLHAGDMFQGTLYFTKYQGRADTDFWNLMRPDAATLGNHEFDKGPAVLQSNLLSLASFPVVSSDIDISRENAIPDKSKVRPFIVLDVGGGKVGVIGLSTPETPFISSPGENIAFLDPAASVQKSVRELEAQGVNKIIVLSHLGYSEDLKLASAVNGVDVIVGGHSHTLLGDFSTIGLSSAGGYPTVVKGSDNGTVLVVQSWEWGKVLGDLDVTFDAEGRVTSYQGAPRAVIGDRFFRIYDIPSRDNVPKRVQFTVGSGNALTINEYDGKSYSVAVTDDPSARDDQYDLYKQVYDKMIAKLRADAGVLLVGPDTAADAKLAGYSQGVKQLQGQLVATADEDLIRGLNIGTGPIIADGMAWKTKADIALNNPGGVRININQGPVSVATVYELLPFANTLVTMPMTGAQVVGAIEDGVDYQIERYGTDPNNAYVYASGIKFTINLGKKKGERISDVVVKTKDGSYTPIDAAATYNVVVNNFMAAGGDKYDTLKSISKQYDTGFNDAEVFMEYIQGKALRNIPEKRITLIR
ncbi:bifunctional metallophosphatase/5'-nucleotidase, partial [Salinispira pacifica]